MKQMLDTGYLMLDTPYELQLADQLNAKLDELGRKLNLFLQSIERRHISEK